MGPRVGILSPLGHEFKLFCEDILVFLYRADDFFAASILQEYLPQNILPLFYSQDIIWNVKQNLTEPLALLLQGEHNSKLNHNIDKVPYYILRRHIYDSFKVHLNDLLAIGTEVVPEQEFIVMNFF